MGNFDFKDKKNIYLIVVCLLIVGLIYYTYDYVYNPYELRKNQLESELSTAQSELDKINAKKHRIAELELQLVQAEKDFEKYLNINEEKLVEYIADDFKDLGILRKDLVKAGNKGLTMASKKTFGNNAYTAWCIRQKMLQILNK